MFIFVKFVFHSETFSLLDMGVGDVYILHNGWDPSGSSATDENFPLCTL